MKDAPGRPRRISARPPQCSVLPSTSRRPCAGLEHGTVGVKLKRAHHFALPVKSIMPGREVLQSPMVACLYRLGRERAQHGREELGRRDAHP